MQGDEEASAIERPTARVILVDPNERILLLLGAGAFVDGIWFAPGGGLGEGETHEDAARREVWEETSHRLERLGPCVWTRGHRWQTAEGTWYHSRERFYLAHVPAFEPRFARPDDPELASVTQHRWWTRDAIAGSRATFAPRRLAALLEPILAGRLPAAPIDVGI